MVSSGVGTVERLGGATSVENVGPEAILHKIKHVTVKLIMRLLIVGGGHWPPGPPVPTPLVRTCTERVGGGETDLPNVL